MKAARATATAAWLLVVGCGPASRSVPDASVTPLVPEARQEVESWDHLIVQLGNERTELVRSASGWRSMAPCDDVPADEPRVHSLLRALGAPLLLRRAHPTEAERARWGLLTPRFQVEVSGPGRHLRLSGGAEDSFDGSVALTREGSDALYALPGGAAQDLAQTAYSLREKRVLRWPAESFARIEVELPREKFALVRKGAKGWRLGDGRAAEAAEVNRALHADLGLRFLRFAPCQPSSYPRLPVITARRMASRWSVTWRHRDGRSVTLTFAGADAERSEQREVTWGRLPSDAGQAWRAGPSAFVKQPL